MEQGIAKIKIDDINFQQLMVNVINRNIRIPDFQREFVWELNQIIRLLDSIYHHYPIGSFLLWKSNDEIESYRTIGDIDLHTAKEGIVYYVLDGQQRITSLFASIENADIRVRVNGKKVTKKIEIYFDLDEEIFLANPFEKFKKIEIYKPKRIVSIPNYSDYGVFFDKFLKKLFELNYSIESIQNWLSEEIYEGKKSYAEMFLNSCVNWEFIKKVDGICVEGKNRNIIFDKDKSLILKVLADYFLWFDHIYDLLLESPDVYEDDLKSNINKRCKEELGDSWYLRQRLYWLKGLGLGEFADGQFYSTRKGTGLFKK